MERQFRLCELLLYMLDSREGGTEFGALSDAVNIQKTEREEKNSSTPNSKNE